MATAATKGTRYDWKKILSDEIVPMIRDFAEKKISMRLRKLFYNLVVRNAIGNTKSDYGTLSDVTVNARMNGDIPIGSIEDAVRDTYNVNHYEDEDDVKDIDDYLDQFIDFIRDAPNNYVYTIPKWYKQKKYVEDWLEKDAIYWPFENYLGDDRQIRVKIDRGYDSLGALVDSVSRLRRIAIDEPHKEIHIKYFGDLDPSGDDMDRDLTERILSISAKLNVDMFTTSYERSRDEPTKLELHKKINDDPGIQTLMVALDNARSENDYRHKITRKRIEGKNSIKNKIRIRKSEIISTIYPTYFPHLFPVIKGKESTYDQNKLFRKGTKIIHFERVAVTEEQILRYDLPDEPRDEQTREKLRNDPRYQSHLRKYGRIIAAEVDALDALHPEVLEKLVQNTVDDNYNTETYKTDVLEKYGSKEYKKEINDRAVEKLRDLLEEMEGKEEEDFEDEEEEKTD